MMMCQDSVHFLRIYLVVTSTKWALSGSCAILVPLQDLWYNLIPSLSTFTRRKSSPRPSTCIGAHCRDDPFNDQKGKKRKFQTSSIILFQTFRALKFPPPVSVSFFFFFFFFFSPLASLAANGTRRVEEAT